MSHELANTNWGVANPRQPTTAIDIHHAQLAVLMDIREVLMVISRKLSALECPNFLAMPYTLNEVATNTRKPRKRRKKAA